VRIVVPFPAGGTSDFVARLYADKLTGAFKQQVLIDNRPGAAGVIAASIVAKANPDGYTLLQAFMSHTINPSIYLALPFDTEKDFVPVALVASSANVVVVPPSLPVKSIREFIDYAKARPGQVNYASAGLGSNSHLSAEMLSAMTGIKMVHVPYKGAPQANAEVVAGAVQVHIPSIPVTLPLIQAGRLKAIAVTSLKRIAVLPDVATVAETLPGYDTLAWDGLLAPRGTPPALVARIAAEVEKALKSPDVVKALTSAGADPDFKGPQQFDAYIKSEMARWSKAARDAGIKPGTL
jgi:tripartite-type tricarboxylate transporter receptor subunit TctC